MPATGEGNDNTSANENADNENDTADNQNDNAPDASPFIYPTNYRESFQLVRECRTSNAHPVNIRVYVNEAGAQAYLADQNPLPLGTIVVKEEYEGDGCNDEALLVRISAMAKMAPGFDAEDNDWRWQQVVYPDEFAFANSKTSCIECHRAAQCVVRDYMCTVP